MKSFYLTTPIYYVNAHPHLGHAYTTIVADVTTRFHQLMGEDAIFITGTDEHGDKIVQAAEKAGQTPEDFTTEISNYFKGMWPQIDTQPHNFVRTTSPEHKAEVQKFLQKVYDSGDIYYGEYGGHYCLGCERFYTEKELENGLCPQHLAKPEYISEKNYFFKMSKYASWLKDYIKKNPDFIRPERYKNEALALLESDELEDLCISRPKSRLTWGIELPFDRNYVCYVWFDALVTYLTALGGVETKEFSTYWSHAEHLIGKDILKPHAIFWPTMLKAAGLPIYKHLNVHGYWLVRDVKMSKTIGNVIVPLDMAKRYGNDAFRYFLLREMHFGNDGSFSEEGLVGRFNADLANDLGNLYSRVLAMTTKYCDGVIPALQVETSLEVDVNALGVESMQNFQTLFGNMRFSQGLESLWEFVRGLNKYVDSAAPWALAKNNETDRLHTVLYTLLEGMRKIAIHLWPVMPVKAEAMLAQLGVTFVKEQVNLPQELQGLVALKAGTKIAQGANLFPRIEFVQSIQPNIEQGQKTNGAPKDTTKNAAKDAPKEQTKHKEKNLDKGTVNSCTNSIDFSDFEKVDLRIGTVVECEKHPNAEKLLRLMVDMGEENPRQIISSLADFFTPENLVGKQVTVVANLAPRKLRGLVSQGMILTVATKDGLALVTGSALAPKGTKIS